MTIEKQMSESLRLNSILAVSGGLMDAYSYIERDHVFANAQTGNILLFGVNLSKGHFSAAMRYFLPFMAFAAGIVLAEELRIRFLKNKSIHWRQLSVLAEALILFAVGLIPLSANNLANAMTSFACGMQVQSFRKAHGNGLATTMCIGNMRSGVHSLSHFFHTGEREYLFRAGIYFDIIGCFVLGAILGSRLIGPFGIRTIFTSSAFLLLSFLMMGIRR